jgi:hypothetical protein
MFETLNGNQLKQITNKNKNEYNAKVNIDSLVTHLHSPEYFPAVQNLNLKASYTNTADACMSASTLRRRQLTKYPRSPSRAIRYLLSRY